MRLDAPNSRVRAAVSEIRTRVGEAAVVTHTQQANGASYGQGTDYNALSSAMFL